MSACVYAETTVGNPSAVKDYVHPRFGDYDSISALLRALTVVSASYYVRMTVGKRTTG